MVPARFAVATRILLLLAGSVTNCRAPGWCGQGAAQEGHGNGGAERPLLALRTPAGRSEGCVRALVVLASAFGEAEVVFRARLRRVTPRHLAERLAQR
jgi:hypothetical protein